MKKLFIIVGFILISFSMKAPTYEWSFPKIEKKELSKNIMDFLIEIKSVETWHDSLNYKYGNPWKCVNKIGAMGAFQFMPSTLRWLGYTGPFKHFLNHPWIQVNYMLKLIEHNKKILSKQSYTYKVTAINFIGKFVHNSEITESGLIAGSHLAGAGGVQRFLANKGNPSDINGTTVKKYINQFKNFDMTIDFNPQSYAAYKLMHDGTIALNHAEQNGFRVDLNYIVKKKDHLKQKMKAAELVFKAGDFFKEWQGSVKDEVNIYSGIQLGKFLYDVKGIKAVKLTATGKGSVDAEALEELNLPELSFYKTRNKFKKAIDVLTSFETEQVNGIIHPSYNLHIARTFRSSANSPNMQNIPKRDDFLLNVCRGAIIPRPGHQLMEIDFKSIEVCINACINKDSNLIKYVSNPNSDMHGDMAKEIFKISKFDKTIDAHATLRQAAKNGFVFPEFYGDFYKQCAVYLAHDWGKLPKGRWKPGDGIEMPEGNLADHMINNGIRSLDGFTEHLKKIERNFWDVRFKQYSWWKNSMWELYRKYGYVELPTGFRCGGLIDRKSVV
jgi:hypothetical protein